MTAQSVKHFTDAAWARNRWSRGSPPQRVIRAQHRHLKCAAGPGHRRAIRRYWEAQRSLYYEHRRAERQRLAVTPYPGPGGSHWGIPWYIVACESGGDYNAQNPASTARGAYQMLDTTYAAYCRACDWSPRDQDWAAHRLYVAAGASPWVCG